MTKNTGFYKIIDFSMQFSAVVNSFIVKHYLILFLQMIKKIIILKNRKMFIIADLVTLMVCFVCSKEPFY